VRSANRQNQGFTLLETMIVVSIIGILAAIAIPAFQNYQNRSKRAEAFTNLSAIVDSEKAYFSEYSTYAGVPVSQPGLAAGVLGPNKRQWIPAADVAFGTVGWRPEGAVYYDYDVNLAGAGSCAAAGDCFTASAYGDADGDGNVAVIEYVQPNASGDVAPTALFGYGPPISPTTGNPMLNQVAVNYAAALY
jgi:prepilin-type N-terminal cleavage/methylation domain-containing protein